MGDGIASRDFLCIGTQRNQRSALSNGSRSSFKHSYHLQTLFAAGQRGLSLFDALKKMLAFDLERLFLLYIRDIPVAIMIRIVEFGKCVVMGGPFHAGVVNLNLFERLDVAINDHPLRPDNSHIAHFSGVEPTALYCREAVLAEINAHRRHVLHARSNMRIAPAIDTPWLLVHNIEHNRNIVWRKVPGHVDILLEQAKIQPPRTDVLNIPNVAP